MGSNEITEKTKVPLAWAIAVVIAICGAVGDLAVSSYRLNALERNFDEYKSDRKDHELSDRAQELRIQRLEDGLKVINDSLVRIEGAITELNHPSHDHR